MRSSSNEREDGTLDRFDASEFPRVRKDRMGGTDNNTANDDWRRHCRLGTMTILIASPLCLFSSLLAPHGRNAIAREENFPTSKISTPLIYFYFVS